MWKERINYTVFTLLEKYKSYLSCFFYTNSQGGNTNNIIKGWWSGNTYPLRVANGILAKCKQ